MRRHRLHVRLREREKANDRRLESTIVAKSSTSTPLLKLALCLLTMSFNIKIPHPQPLLPIQALSNLLQVASRLWTLETQYIPLLAARNNDFVRSWHSHAIISFERRWGVG